MSSLHLFCLSESEKLKSLLYPRIKNHTMLLMAVSEPLRAVNLISFSGLISIRRVKPLRVLLRSLAQWRIAQRFLSPHCLPFYSLGVSLQRRRTRWGKSLLEYPPTDISELSLLQSCHYTGCGSHLSLLASI